MTQRHLRLHVSTQQRARPRATVMASDPSHAPAATSRRGSRLLTGVRRPDARVERRQDLVDDLLVGLEHPAVDVPCQLASLRDPLSLAGIELRERDHPRACQALALLLVADTRQLAELRCERPDPCGIAWDLRDQHEALLPPLDELGLALAVQACEPL